MRRRSEKKENGIRIRRVRGRIRRRMRKIIRMRSGVRGRIRRRRRKNIRMRSMRKG